MVVSTLGVTTKGDVNRVDLPTVISLDSEETKLQETALRRKNTAWKDVVVGPTPYRESSDRTCLEDDEVRATRLACVCLFQFPSTNLPNSSPYR